MTSSPVRRDRLVIFTRYPQPGQTKTRLIPALGPEGAARLQRQMTELTCDRARQLRAAGVGDRRDLEIEIRFTGGDRQAMQQWLGDDLLYETQGDGDLGDRLARAVDRAFGSGAERVVVVGIDCPHLETPILQQAFSALDRAPVVLGPALDGGYYAIAVRRPYPQLFEGIPWGTEKVFQQTIDKCHNSCIEPALLPPLADIDRPEDLDRLPDFLRRTLLPKISTIIPVLNEAERVRETLASVTRGANIEAIVVDGGSRDDTPAIVESLGVRLLHSPPGRALQMNAGARAATGSILLFLHGDTRLPSGFETAIREILTRPGVVGGAFPLAIDSQQPSLKLLATAANWRSHFWQMPYGDQGLFVPREIFWDLGGFPELPIMEDYEFVRQLQRRGRIAIAPTPVQTSARRWQQLGAFKTTAINQAIVLGYSLGVSPERLARWYRQSRDRA